MSTDPSDFVHPIDGSQHGHNPVSADMESIIAAALTTHWARTMCSEGDGFYIECRCGEIGHVESDAEDWEPANQWSAAHQARAVLAAISEAGAVDDPEVCGHALDSQGAEFGPKSPCTKPTGHDQYHRDNAGVAFGPYQGDPNE